MPVVAEPPPEVAPPQPAAPAQELAPEQPLAPVEGEAGPAPPPPSPLGLEIGGVASYVSAPIRGGTNPFGAGLGGRVALELSGFYVGAAVVGYFGGTDVDVRYRAFLAGAELGYGLHVLVPPVGFIDVRPRIGVGNASVYYTDPSLRADVVTSASGASSSSDTLTVNNLYLQPGLTLQLSAAAVYVAVEGGALVLPGIAYGGADATTWISYDGRVELGLRF
ncbi:MAG: hypothetical protein ACRELB_01790 [Polyangiaceae bacterium]